MRFYWRKNLTLIMFSIIVSMENAGERYSLKAKSSSDEK
jgi:hypothetical protein